MSFLKELFGKSKDSKYGKGHKLGTAQDNVPARPSTSVPQQRPSTSSMITANEASRKAAEAALMRAQNQSKLFSCFLTKHCSLL
jgi:hypothetical protein